MYSFIHTSLVCSVYVDFCCVAPVYIWPGTDRCAAVCGCLGRVGSAAGATSADHCPHQVRVV